MQRPNLLQSSQLGSKIENTKNMLKTNLQEHYSCSVKKTSLKNTNYSRKKTILKIGDLAKAIAHVKAIGLAKWSV